MCGTAKNIPSAILSLSHHQRKRGSWGCQECDVLIGTNLQICNPPNYFIVLSGKHCSSEARQAGKEVTKPLAFERLGDKGAAVEAAIFDPCWGQVVVEILSALEVS